MNISRTLIVSWVKEKKPQTPPCVLRRQQLQKIRAKRSDPERIGILFRKYGFSIDEARALAEMEKQAMNQTSRGELQKTVIQSVKAILDNWTRWEHAFKIATMYVATLHKEAPHAAVQAEVSLLLGVRTSHRDDYDTLATQFRVRKPTPANGWNQSINPTRPIEQLQGREHGGNISTETVTRADAHVLNQPVRHTPGETLIQPGGAIREIYDRLDEKGQRLVADAMEALSKRMLATDIPRIGEILRRTKREFRPSTLDTICETIIQEDTRHPPAKNQQEEFDGPFSRRINKLLTETEQDL
jgi:hypothetical protein